jgi:hypothetical protein
MAWDTGENKWDTGRIQVANHITITLVSVLYTYIYI